MVFPCWTIFGPTCVTAGFWTSWLSKILGLVVVTVIYCLPSQYRPTIICSWTWPKSCLFEHSLPELVQNEWNATVIGGKGSSLWSRNRGLSLSLSAIRVTENHSMIGQWRFNQPVVEMGMTKSDMVLAVVDWGKAETALLVARPVEAAAAVAARRRRSYSVVASHRIAGGRNGWLLAAALTTHRRLTGLPPC